MQAAVLFEQRKPMQVEEVELAPPQYGEVMVRMVAGGICHSCLHAADGSWEGIPVPIVLGDEGAGVVEELGPGVHDLQVGDHVILSWAPTCGSCYYCATGRPVLCERKPERTDVLLDGTTRMSLGEQPIYQFAHVATYASHSVVPASCAIPIRKDMPLDKAALIGCSVMTGVGSVINTAGGAARREHGGVRCGRHRPQRHPRRRPRVRPSDYRRGREPRRSWNTRRRWGPRIWLTLRVRTRCAPSSASPAAAPSTRSWPWVRAGSLCRAARRSHPVGPVCSSAPRPATRTSPLMPGQLGQEERVIRGSTYGSARTRADFPRMVELYLAGKLKIDELITNRYGLDEANEAFRALAAGEVARGLIVF